MLESTGILHLHSSPGLQSCFSPTTEHWAVLTLRLNDRCPRSLSLLQQQKKAVLVVNSDTHFESQVGVSSDFCSISSMKDHLQVGNDFAVHNTTSSLNHTDCLFPPETQAKIHTFQATVNSLSAKVAFLLSYLGLEEQSTMFTDCQSIRYFSRPSYRARLCQR